MFGGWKIIKHIREAKAKAGEAQAFEMQQPMLPAGARAFAQGAGAGGSAEFDEAFVLEEDLSTIETWRRGIVPFGEDGSADVELISPEAMRSRLGEEERGARGGRDARSVKTPRDQQQVA